MVCRPIIAALICTIYSIFPCSYAANHIEDDSNSGVLHVHGALMESACRLNMASEWQDINLGEIGTARLAHIGDQGYPVVVQLYLRDCQRTGGQYDERTGNFVWAAYQPAVSVSFTAVADVDNPQLIQVKGSSGLALRLTDKYGRDVRLGSRGEPLLLIPGQDALTYHIIPERTRAPLRAGTYSALVNFRLNYE
ncbi:fimbrial protein [Rouxiella sp. Mn2063]|uniref:fimbrial protein n=1 Tax=Rouxiella sp. Mn2063 TaxID=3395262 RepID=UPI003BCF19DC